MTASRSGSRKGRATGGRRVSPRSRRSSSRRRTRSRISSWRPSAGRRSSRRASGRTPAGPCCSRAGGPGRGRRSGSSASGRPTCSRSPPATAASRSSSRPTASACPTCSTSTPCGRSWAASSGGRSPSTRSRPTKASPFAASLLFDYVAAYMYEGDTPLAERRAGALALDRDLLRELLGQEELRELLDAEALADLELSLQALTEDRRAGTPDQLHDLLRRLGDLTAAEAGARVEGGGEVADGWLAELRAARRAVVARIGGEDRWIAIEDSGRYRDGVGASPPIGIPEAFLVPVSGALDGLLARWARTHGPFLPPDPARRWGLPIGVVEDTLERLAERGSLVRGEFRPDGTEREWCDPEVLRLLRRRSLARLRREVEPVEPAALGRFLPAWQGVAPVGEAPPPLRGTRGARAARRGRGPAVRRRDPGVRAGAGRPARPRARLPAPPPRRAGCARRGRLGRAWEPRPRRWPGRALPAGPRGPPPGRLARRCRAAGRAPPRGDPGPCCGRRGASFYRDLYAAAGGGADREVLDALWDLVWAGEVTNDTFAPLRALRWKRPARPTARPRAGRLTALGPPEAAGRWSLVEEATPAGSPTERLHATALALLDRHGVLVREAVMAEGVEGGFAGLYPVLRALEEAGRIRRGYFVEGLGRGAVRAGRGDRPPPRAPAMRPRPAARRRPSTSSRPRTRRTRTAPPSPGRAAATTTGARCRVPPARP